MERDKTIERHRLQDAYLDLILQMRPNAFVTLTTNDTTRARASSAKKPENGPPLALTWRYQSEPQVSEGSRILQFTHLVGEYLAMMDRALLGRNWSAVTPDKRTDGIFFIEHTGTNIHAHGLLRFPQSKTHDLQVLTLLKWNKLTQSGDTNFKTIYDLDGVAEYCTKEIKRTQFTPDQVVLARQFMAA